MSLLKFSKDHEWIRVDGDEGTVGISAYAQEALGDVVFIELPEIGATVSKSDEIAVVESVKAASEIYSPVSGQIAAVNLELEADPSIVNNSPLDGGWFFKIKIKDLAELEDLMDEPDYEAFLKDLD
jgi:glycine cleavage system H protein